MIRTGEMVLREESSQDTVCFPVAHLLHHKEAGVQVRTLQLSTEDFSTLIA